jgi:hypothetical protein
MPQSCFACKAVASGGVTFSYCGACQSVQYCSKVCQKKDWKEGEHKKICKSLYAGDGAMQMRRPEYEGLATKREESFKANENRFNDDMKRFLKLFKESTFEGSKAAARKMKKIAARQTKHIQKVLLFHSLYLLIRTDSKMLLWPNSPLLVLLQFVDPSVLSGPDHEATCRFTLLHGLASLVDPTSSDYSTHENQLTLGRQLIARGANVNAVTFPNSDTPLHSACDSDVTTNLDFIQLLLENGADPNTQDHLGQTPLMYTLRLAPGAAKFLLEWPTTDVNITTRSGASFLALVRETVAYFSVKAAIPDNPHQVEHHFLLQQWLEIEKMLVEREAVDTGITAVQ